jgi:ABC-type oligopeptide transport system substrate-binding subunit
MYEDAIHATSKGDALKAFNQAEVVLLQNPPFIPLWYSADYHIVYSNVRNLHFNPLNFLVLKRVYKKAWTVNEYRRKKVKP